MASSFSNNFAPLEELYDHLHEMETCLMDLSVSCEDNPPNPEKMKIDELLYVMQVFAEVVALGKKVVMPPSPEPDPAWDRCLAHARAVMMYIEQIEVRPLMALGYLGTIVNDTFGHVTEFGVELQIMGADADESATPQKDRED
jgi:hypothetical protein